MGKKLRQVTDNVHGTIYLSEVEYNLISTPFFYRLHDIYQSSTVYLTFPSNRTKRYEHSIGTMELASELFFACMTNAKRNDRKDFLEQLYKELYFISGKLHKAEINNAEYLKKVEGLDQVFPKRLLNPEDLDKCIFDTIKNERILDSALEHYSVCFFDTLNAESTEQKDVSGQIAKYLYIYQAILEAIRIAALFHDVGHPPYSHIIEEVLMEIYSVCKQDEISDTPEFNKGKRETLLSCLEAFVSQNDIKNKRLAKDAEFLLIDKSSESKSLDMALHEQVGLKMLQLAIEEVFPRKIGEIKHSDLQLEEKVGKALYYVLVVEFTFAILLEKSMLFKSIHRIIDGVIDADRLDYIVRDSQNSGVDWGKIPYKRVINSAKLVRPLDKETNFFAVAFPQKEQEDLEDILLMRYKIFSRINYHHRSVKTAVLLQNAIKELAFDYLKSKEKSEISIEISGLWTALGATLGEKALQVGKWNDSWLITVLYDALIKLSDDNCFNEFINSKNKDENLLEKIRNLLEEVLLNHKHYYSLFKRKGDLIKLAELIFQKSRIKTAMNRVKKREMEKYLDSSKSQEQHSEAEESLVRINLFEKTLQEGDFDLFQIIFPSDKSIVSLVTGILETEKKKGRISDFYVLDNKGRNKKGLPKSDDITKKIYLYDNDMNVQEYTGYTELEAQINLLRAFCLSFYVYIEYSSDAITQLDVLESIANGWGKELKSVFEELFPSHRVDSKSA